MNSIIYFNYNTVLEGGSYICGRNGGRLTTGCKIGGKGDFAVIGFVVESHVATVGEKLPNGRFHGTADHIAAKTVSNTFVALAVLLILKSKRDESCIAYIVVSVAVALSRARLATWH